MAYGRDYQTVTAQQVREDESENASCQNQGGMKIFTPAGGFKLGASTKADDKEPVANLEYLQGDDPGKKTADKDAYQDITVGNRGSHGAGVKVS